jgi:tetratricopeptide (TPR) repeat protein
MKEFKVVNRNKWFIIIFALNVIVQSTLFSDDKDIALNYVAQADRLYAAGNSGEAEKLLLSSLEFWPGFSESCFLLYRINCSNQATTRKGFDYLLLAIKNGSWKYTEPSLAQRELGKIYLQTRRFAEAKTVLLKDLNRRLEDPLVYYYLIRSLGSLHESALFERTLGEALDRFPQYSDFYITAARYYNGIGQNKKAVDFIDNGISEIPDDEYLLLVKSTLSNNSEEKKTLLNRYFAKKGEKPEAYVEAIRAKLGTPSMYIGLFIEKGGLHYADLLDELNRLVSANDKKIIATAMGKYNGDSIVDEDGDGLFEERYVYKNGKLQIFQLDRNQDGIPEIELLFESGKPEKLSFADSETHVVSCIYSAYPFLKSVSFFNSITEKKYILLPTAYSIRIVDFPAAKSGSGSNEPIRLKINQTIKIPSEDRISAAAFRVDEYTLPSFFPGKSSDLLSGKTILVKIDESGNHRYDHIINYANNLPVSGVRDLDSDGEFETTETYLNGHLTQLLSDKNNNGKPDFIELFSENGNPKEFRWDYTHDGIMDTIEYITGPHKVTYVFSTHYNGIFDLRMSFDSDKLIEIKRNGNSMKIIPGKNKNIYWIGTRGPDIEIDPSMQSGKIEKDGKTFFIFNFSNIIYVEEIR